MTRVRFLRIFVWLRPAARRRLRHLRQRTDARRWLDIRSRDAADAEREREWDEELERLLETAPPRRHRNDTCTNLAGHHFVNPRAGNYCEFCGADGGCPDNPGDSGDYHHFTVMVRDREASFGREAFKDYNGDQRYRPAGRYFCRFCGTDGGEAEIGLRPWHPGWVLFLVFQVGLFAYIAGDLLAVMIAAEPILVVIAGIWQFEDRITDKVAVALIGVAFALSLVIGGALL